MIEKPRPADVLVLLPKAALAGIVANAVLSLIDVKGLRALYRNRRSEFWIAVRLVFRGRLASESWVIPRRFGRAAV